MKTALITGAAKRIGRKLALHLAGLGWKVIIHYHQSEAEALALQAEIGANATLLQADLSDPQAVEELQIECDLLINNAAHFSKDSADNFTAKELQKHFQINLYAPMLLTQKMKQGAVINLLDQWALDSPEGFLTYSLSKQALANFTLEAAKQLTPKVRVNAISPGVVLFKQGQSEIVFEQLQKKYPGSVEGVCQMLDFILSDVSINGEILIPNS